ncbi:hypothetical protein GCM10010472_39750 [Pseudonocardia halophobica]|uniref:Uncharacterized protein n=1 Tax=Pseudonocardia halophobica TaxID=29401 RepID=A0A9W6L932_9PSEU|nr:hypothetical protein [Pseudonocardia halophobica]GLL14269.1 hypothetical protein GCM10017577_54160 [Pseudonocardia halophobica]
MAERAYNGTAVAFEGMTLPEIRDPVATGPGPGSMRAAEQALAEVSRKLADVNAELEALEREYADAHEGEAAEGTRMYLRKLGEPGRVGTVMFQLAARALGDQAEYYTVAHRELAALQPSDSHLGNSATSQLALERQQSAAHVANRYQENSNANLSTAFQAFTPLALPTPDTAAVAPATAPGWPDDRGAAVSAAPTTVATAPPGTGGSPAPPGMPAPVPSGPTDVTAPPVAPAATPPGPAAASGRAGTPSATPVQGTPPAGRAPTPIAGLSRSTRAATPPLPSGDRPLAPRAAVDLPPGVLSPSVPRAPGRYGSASTAMPSARPLETGRTTAPRTTAPRLGEPAPRLAPVERLRGADPLAEQARPAPAARSTSSHLPFVPAGVGGTRRGEPHPRPDWLVEDDPEGVWLADVPTYGPGVLRGEDGGTGSGM